MNNDKDSSFRRYKFKSDFVNAGLMFATATLTAAGGFVFQKTTGLPLDSISPTLKSLFPLAVGAGVATLTTLNPVPAAFSFAFATAQHFLGKKLSRNIEERADIEGAKLAGVTAEQLEESITFYDKLHCEMQGKKPLAGREQEYPTRKQVIETARMVLN